MEKSRNDQPIRKLQSKKGKDPSRLTAASAERSKVPKKKEKIRPRTSKKRGHVSSTPSTADEAENTKSQTIFLPPSELQTTTRDSKDKSDESKNNKKIEFPSLSTIAQEDPVNESLRWEGVLEDPVAEEERIRQYKINRRKRYLLAAQKSFSVPSLGLEEPLQLSQKQYPYIKVYSRNESHIENAVESTSDLKVCSHLTEFPLLKKIWKNAILRG